MKSGMVFYTIGLLLIYVIDLHKSIRKKDKKSVIAICILLSIATTLAGIYSVVGLNPLYLLHWWLSPLGRLIWGN
ncbi:hypothetical protein ACFQ3W_16580 [Paenibacillus puldeungensis]|uniref:Uncharacterized protein n=1 Tax=Paenibacillus puldeungensis TaxID=696536 RepID=A0ABW3RZV7_9BACL